MLRLKELRGNRTQDYTAKQLGLTQRSYQNYECGSRQADYDTLIKMARYFGVTIDYLLGASDAPYGEKATYEIELVPESEDERKMLDLYRAVKQRGGAESAMKFLETLEEILKNIRGEN